MSIYHYFKKLPSWNTGFLGNNGENGINGENVITIFPIFPIIPFFFTLGKRRLHSFHGLQATNFKNYTKPLKQSVFYNPLQLFRTNQRLWKCWAHSFHGLQGKKWKIHKTTEAMDFMWSLFHLFTQITPLDNRNHKVCMYYNQLILRYCI